MLSSTTRFLSSLTTPTPCGYPIRQTSRESSIPLMAIGTFFHIAIGELDRLRKNQASIEKEIGTNSRQNAQPVVKQKKPPSEFVLAKNLVAKHRFVSGGELVAPQENSGFFDCDPTFTKLFHQLAAKIFTEENLEEHAPMMRKRARQLIEQEKTLYHAIVAYYFQVMCPILAGERANSGMDMSFLKNTNYCLWLDKEIDSIKNLKSTMPLMLINNLTSKQDEDRLQDRLSEDQIDKFQKDLIIAGKDNTIKVIEYTLLEYAKDPQLQDQAFQSLQQSTTDINELIEKAVVEAQRLHRQLYVLRHHSKKKEDATIMLDNFAENKDIVGPNPRVFNPNRLKTVPEDLTKLPGIPFGIGPHICPGWRVYKYMTVQFLTEIILHYHIKSKEEIIPRQAQAKQRLEMELKLEPKVMSEKKEDDAIVAIFFEKFFEKYKWVFERYEPGSRSYWEDEKRRKNATLTQIIAHANGKYKRELGFFAAQSDDNRTATILKESFCITPDEISKMNIDIIKQKILKAKLDNIPPPKIHFSLR